MELRQRLLLLLTILTAGASAREPLYHYSFFHNSRMPGHYFYTKVVGEGVKNIRGKLPVSETIFHTPGNALQLEYVNAANSKWQAMIFRQQIRGQDHFAPPRFLSFWVYKTSAATSEKELPSVFLISKDSVAGKPFDFAVKENNAWIRILIPLNLNDSTDPFEMIGIGFGQRSFDGNKHQLYIDDIELVSEAGAQPITQKPVIATATGGPRHVDLTWSTITDTAVAFAKIYCSADKKIFNAVGIQSAYINRYADYTGETGKQYNYRISFLNKNYEETAPSKVVSATTRAMKDEELLTMVQQASFRY